MRKVSDIHDRQRRKTAHIFQYDFCQKVDSLPYSQATVYGLSVYKSTSFSAGSSTNLCTRVYETIFV